MEQKAVKKIRLIFKNGTVEDVIYSAKAMAELREKLGESGKVEYNEWSVMTKDLQAVVEVTDSQPETAGKKIRLIFKSGRAEDVAYGPKVWGELREKIGKDGKDGKVEYNEWSVLTKDLQAVVFIPAEG